MATGPFVKVTRMNGRPAWINVAQIHGVVEAGDPDRPHSEIWLNNGEELEVQEAPDKIMRTIAHPLTRVGTQWDQVERGLVLVREE